MLGVSDRWEGAPEEDPSPLPEKGCSGKQGPGGEGGNGLFQGGAYAWGRVTERPKCPSEAWGPEPGLPPAPG